MHFLNPVLSSIQAKVTAEDDVKDGALCSPRVALLGDDGDYYRALGSNCPSGPCVKPQLTPCSANCPDQNITILGAIGNERN